MCNRIAVVIQIKELRMLFLFLFFFYPKHSTWSYSQTYEVKCNLSILCLYYVIKHYIVFCKELNLNV